MLMAVLNVRVMFHNHFFDGSPTSPIFTLEHNRTKNQVTTALISFQYFVHEVGFQVFMADVTKSFPRTWTGKRQNPRAKKRDQTSLY